MAKNVEYCIEMVGRLFYWDVIHGHLKIVFGKIKWPHKEMLMIRAYVQKEKQDLGLYLHYDYNSVSKDCEETKPNH